MSGKKDCKFCDKRGLLWLPLRYSAVGAPNLNDLNALPPLKGKLGKGVTDIALTHAKYAVRLLRAGYLYVLLERNGIKYWEAYMVLEDAFLYKFDPEKPPQLTPEFSCERHTCGINASMVSIPEAKDVPNIWAMFTPSALTKATLAEYKRNADTYASQGKLQVFHPAAWLAGTTTQPHSLLAPELLTQVADYVLFTQSGNPHNTALGKALQQQLFPTSIDAYCGTPPDANGRYGGRLGTLHQKIRHDGHAAFVLHDAIGITQELNDFRNAPFEGLQNYLAATDEYGASNEYRLQIHEAIEEVKAGYLAGIINDSDAFLEQHKNSSDSYFKGRLKQAQQLRQQGHEEDARALEAQVDTSLKVRASNYAKAQAEAKAKAADNWEKKYARRLNAKEMKTFKARLDSLTTHAAEVANQRANDHLQWLTSERLISAFDVFDKAHAESGYNFAAHSAICTIGLSGCKAGEDKLDEWIKAPSIERKNIYMRGVLFNQSMLVDEANSAYGELGQHASEISSISAPETGAVIKATKALVSGFKSIDSAFDEWARNQGGTFAKKWGNSLEVLLYQKMSDMTRTVFRSGIGGSFDQKLTARISGLLFARLGPIAERINYTELMLKIPANKLAEGHKGRSAERNRELAERKVGPNASKVTGQQLENTMEDLVADARKKAQAKVQLTLDEIKKLGDKGQPTNNYHQTRIGVVLGCIEMIALGEKLRHFPTDANGWIGIGGSVLSVGSIVLDTYYSAAKSIREIKPYKDINAINKGADIVRGGFKLGAAVLGAGAGVCGAILDWSKLRGEKDAVMKWTYGLRAMTGGLGAGFTLVAGFSYSAPLLTHMAKGFAKSSLRYRFLQAAIKSATWLSARVRLLVWVARINMIGLALTALEIGYMICKDDDLQNWLERCVFRREKQTNNLLGGKSNTEYFGNMESELKALAQIYNSVEPH